MKETILKLFQLFGLEPFPVGHPAVVIGRSSLWSKVRKQHLQLNPRCCVSGLKSQLEVHHIKPYHLFPELELDPDNLRTISRPYHFLIGHLCNWSNYNPDFDNTVVYIRSLMIKESKGIYPLPWLDND